VYAETTTSAKQQSVKMIRQYQLGTITHCLSSANMSAEHGIFHGVDQWHPSQRRASADFSCLLMIEWE
jgi:hypothetical protein